MTSGVENIDDGGERARESIDVQRERVPAAGIARACARDDLLRGGRCIGCRR
jgi:hypothetical protein